MNNTFSVLVGLLLRIGIPIGISLLVFFLLRRLDNRWQKEANLLPVAAMDQKPCWEVKNCSETKRKDCPVAAQPNVPCWQAFRTKDGLLKEACLDCDVFRQALTPARS
ncbi:MAG: hypothetical protein HY781_08355 [Chloroflexi bacterium]|nr:hypothetical protein [Chloroflexota bacterium]